VARRIGQDERPLRRREVAVRHVDRDALLALGAQAVDEEREIGRRETLVDRGAFDGVDVVSEDGLRVEEETSDECGFSVVDAAGRREAQQLDWGVQK
jgi:hypothetical protein